MEQILKLQTNFKETQWLIVLVDIWLVKDNRYSEEKDSFLQSADMVVTHKISSSIAYQLLKNIISGHLFNALSKKTVIMNW